LLDKFRPRQLAIRFHDFRIYFLSMICLSIYLAYVVRPVQDDYVVLRDMANGSAITATQNLWLHWGGNVTASFFVNTLVGVSPRNYPFLGLALQSVLTLLLLTASVIILAKWSGMADFLDTEVKRNLILVLSMVSMGGLATPTYISIFNFSWASSAHLWPIMLGIVAIYLISILPTVCWPGLLILGFMAGNCNVTESAFLVLASFLLLSLSDKKIGISFRAKNMLAFGSGSFFGLMAIILAPGFRERAEIVGGPTSIFDAANRFLRAFTIDFGDFVIHPVWLLGLLIGIAAKDELLRFRTLPDLNAKKNVVGIGTLILFMLIVIGDTVAYPSWYHTTPIYLLVFPLFFLIGATLSTSKYLSKNHLSLKILTCIVISLVLTLAARDFLYLGVRKMNWDEDFKLNVCQIQRGETRDLQGKSFTYPPLGLGVEDVQRWPWIEVAYSQWVQADHLRC
jgi:hypothetical protein